MLAKAPEGLIDEALNYFPDAEGDGSIFMPTTRGIGRCRICGEEREMTKEHIPPATAFNRGPLREHSLDEYLHREDEELPGGRLRQGGMWGYTLCETCNNLTGRLYAPEYGRWARTAVNAMADARVNVYEVDRQTAPVPGRLAIAGDPGPRPGAFVREALAITCSLSGPFDLAGRFPAIRRIVLDGATEPLPTGMSIGLALVLPPSARLVGPAAVIELDTPAWRWVIEMAHAPLAILLVLTSTRPVEHRFDLSRYTLLRPDEPAAVDGPIDLGFAHTVYAGDYRSRGALESLDPGEDAERRPDPN